MKKETKPDLDISAEEKIKTAARKLFTQKGYAAVKTRDIAAEAGINLALLNYYFRSKEKLFEIVMTENMGTFVEGAAVIIHNSTTSFDEKIELLSSHYINILLKNPDVPRFVINEIQNHPEKLAKAMQEKLDFFNSIIIRQLMEKVQKGEMMAVHPVHFIVNLIGLCVFPFLAKPLVANVTHANEEALTAIMEERKKLIPIWIKGMYKPQPK